MLYKRIKERREYLGFSQDELAEKMGYKSRSTIAKIEAGINDIPQSKIEAFATALKTTPSFLMGWTNTPEVIHQPTKKIHLTKHERDIFKTLKKINDAGQKKVLDYTKDLSTNPFYIKENKEIFINAAHAIPGATKEELQHDEDIMNDENF